MGEVRPEIWNGVPVPYGLPIDELERRLAQADPTAWAAYMALAHNPDPRALAILRRSARSSDWSIRRMATEAVSKHSLAHTASELILAALHDVSPFVVRTACEAVTRLRIMPAHDDVLGLLSAEEAATRAEALRAVAALWKPSDFSPVLGLAQADPSEEVRREAAWTLRSAVDAATWKRLFDLWKTDELPRHREWAVQLAEEFGQDSARAELEALAHDVNGHVRKAASRALQAGATWEP